MHKEILKPRLIIGGRHTDDRGVVSFINDFEMEPVKRVYFIEHANTSFIRGWQGHLKENKWFYVVKGAFDMRLLATESFSSPFEQVNLFSYTMDAAQPMVLHVPGGFLTSFRALEEGAILQVFSDFTVQESKDDDYRFPLDKWNIWNS